MTEAECVEELREAPGDEGKWAVYADLLQARGELRGELITLALSRKHRRERLFRDKHRAALGLTALLDLLEARRLSVDWSCGHLAAMTLQAGRHRRSTDWPWVRVLEEVVAHPLALALQRVHVQGVLADEECRSMVDALVAHGAALGELTLLPEGGRVHAGPLLGLPRLVKLSVGNVESLLGGTAPRLRELTVFGVAEQETDFQLGTLDAPRLGSLFLRSWSDTRPAVSRWLREGCRAPSLKRLSLEVRFTSQVIDAVADAPFAGCLERLSVITMDEASAEVLLRRKADLPRLSAVTAHHQRLPQATEQRLRAEFPG